MKLVKFTKDMRPHVAGETRVVPDDVAAQLAKSGDATIEPSVYDQQRPAKSYRTREKRA